MRCAGARVKSQLRRYNQLGGSVKEEKDEIYEVRDRQKLRNRMPQKKAVQAGKKN